MWEVERTLDLSKRLLPVIHKPVPDNDIPEQLRRLQFVRFDTGRGVTRPLAELADALRVDLDWIREHTRLGELAVRWQRAGRPELLLLRGDDLDAAKAWMARRTRPLRPRSPRRSASSCSRAKTRKARGLARSARSSRRWRRAQAATARQQKRAHGFYGASARWCWLMIGYVTWQGYDVARREARCLHGRATRP